MNFYPGLILWKLIVFKYSLGGGRGRVALADEDGDSDLDERFGNLGVRYTRV